MATDNNSEFYKELDGYRHRSGCSSLLIWLIIGLVVVLGAVVLLYRRFL